MDTGKNKCILVVDDSKLNREILVEFLKTKDFHILEAADGKEALEKIKSNNPDLILLDLIMPVMDGFETMENLKKENNKTPIIVITAYIKDNTYMRCKELGAVGFLNKPVKMQELYKIISGVIE
jgi:two-component system chemotaxis sensor kinase CheA